MNENDIDGEISFVIDYLDLAGNYSQSLTTTDSSAVRFDKTLPLLPEISIFSSNIYDSTLATSGNTATINFVSNEIIQTPQVLIQGDTAIVSGDGYTWSAIQVLSQENIDGPVDFSIDYLDLAGNVSQSTQTTDETAVLFDKTLPVITDLLLAPATHLVQSMQLRVIQLLFLSIQGKYYGSYCDDFWTRSYYSRR